MPLNGASTPIGTTCVEARIEFGGSDSIDGGQKKRGAVGRGVKKPTAPRGPRLPDQDRGASLERRPKRTIPVGAHSFLRACLLAGLTKKFQFLPIVQPRPGPGLDAYLRPRCSPSVWVSRRPTSRGSPGAHRSRRPQPSGEHPASGARASDSHSLGAGVSGTRHVRASCPPRAQWHLLDRGSDLRP